MRFLKTHYWFQNHKQIYSDFSDHSKYLISLSLCKLIYYTLFILPTFVLCEFIRLNTSLVTRKSVFVVCDQVRLKPACSAIETS